MGWGCGSLEAQLLSMSPSSGKAGFIVICGPLVDRALLGDDAVGVGLVGGSGGVGGGADVGDGSGEGGLILVVELFEPGALLAPMVRLPLLDDEQDGECEADGDPGDALHVEQAQDHALGSPVPSASMVAPSRPAIIFRRPIGPPASKPTMTTIIATMKPPSDQPKMVTIVCSSDRLQPPHIRSATMNPEKAPQNMPAADASRP